MACAKNYIVTWGDGDLRFYNTSFQYGGSFGQSIEMKGMEKGKFANVESFRIQNGGALLIANNEKKIGFFEIVMPYKTAPPFDFGNMRFIV